MKTHGRSDSRLHLRATWMAMKATGVFSTRLGGRYAAVLWFTPWRLPLDERARAREAERLGNVERVEFVAEGQRLAGWTAGSGPTVLLVHGWSDRAATLGAFVEPLTRAGFRVVGVDLPGHGASGDGPTDLYSLADVVRNVAEQTGARAVVAHSMGGATSLLACRDGLGLDAMVLIASSVRLEHALEPFRRLFAIPPKAMAGLRQRIEDRFGSDVWDDVAVDAVATHVTARALVVHDVEDRQVDIADARQLVDAWPHARLMTTSGLGHHRIARDPEVVAKSVEHLVSTLLPEPRAARREPADPPTVA